MTRLFAFNDKNTKLISGQRILLRKAASSSCHPSRRRMNSSDLEPYLIHGSLELDPSESVPDSISIDSAVFAQHVRATNTHTHTHTDIQTTVRVTSMLCMRCNLIMNRLNRLLIFNVQFYSKSASRSHSSFSAVTAIESIASRFHI